MGRFYANQENSKARFLRLFQYPGMFGNINARLHSKGLLDLVLNNQIAEPFAPFGVCEEVVIAEEYEIRCDLF